MGLFSKTYSIGQFEFGGHQVEIVNWYRMLPTQSEMSFSIDGDIIAKTRKLSHLNPNEPVFQLFDVSGKIKQIEVFVIGATRIKFSARINDEIVYRDNITYADRLQKNTWGPLLLTNFL